nr:flagellar motor switch phosphatase FliY [Lachnospiraceae bacterium]
MDGMLSQEEINALLNDTGDSGIGLEDEFLTPEEKDAIGEISNISMGTAATTLFSLVNRKVEISTPVVDFCTWEDIVAKYERPCVFIRIAYTVGLNGSNILVLKEKDVKVITDLMMGGDGTNCNDELGELHLSAISEAMNQMMGSSATSLSSMLNKMIDISPPMADLVDLGGDVDESQIDEFLAGRFVKISFRMEIGNLVDSEIMQLYPFSFAREMYNNIAKNMDVDVSAMRINEEVKKPNPQPQPISNQSMDQNIDNQQMMGQPMMGQPMMGQPMMGQPMQYTNMQMQQPVNVQAAQFQTFSSD